MRIAMRLKYLLPAPRPTPPPIPRLTLCGLAAACMLLAGCGYRGPLYIPGKVGDPAYDRAHPDEAAKAKLPGGGTRTGPATTTITDDRTNGVNDSHP
jgi:predicted small lipoprotein YifL